MGHFGDCENIPVIKRMSRDMVIMRIGDSCYRLWRMYLGWMVTLKLEKSQETADIFAGEMRILVGRGMFLLVVDGGDVTACY